MPHPSLSLLVTLSMAAALPCIFTGCEKKAAAPKKQNARTPVEPVTVEQKADGLFYRTGETAPFTGEAVTPHPDALWLVMKREPFIGGKRHGAVTEFYRSGKTKSLRQYEQGVPQWTESYYMNGQLKFRLLLNSADKAEGPYKRFYENGKLQAEATFDSEERWHGDSKEWSETGEPMSHYEFDHGVITRIVFETDEAKKTRIASGVKTW